MKHLQSNQNNSNNQLIAVKNPIRKIYQLSISVFMLLLFSLLLISCSEKQKKAPKSNSQVTVEKPIKTDAALTLAGKYEIVPNEKVCMVNDRFMVVPQIPIDVSGTTYYGCCEDCVEKLQKNLNDVRFGSNPLTNTKVDKATAIIVQNKDNGSVYYFSSEAEANTFITE